MNKFKVLCISLVSVVLLQACNDDDDNEVVIVDEPVASMTIVDTAVSAGNFTTLVAALQATGLDATLSDTSQKFTVFAPRSLNFSS